MDVGARAFNLLTGFQSWRSLLFVHWAVPADVLRPLVSPSLEIDSFDGRAFVGLVAFDIPELRPVRALPPPPGAGRFLETNLRTYVKHQGEPGVWFFSLDAASSLAVLGARASYGLPYFRADMNWRRDGERVDYHSQRRWPAPGNATLDLEYEIGPSRDPAVPGTLEHFLVERYRLFARHPLLGLCEGQVRHHPYPLRQARTTRLDQTLLAAAGITATGDRTPDWFSEGVDVEILPPRPLGKRR
jgi:uncharacterized protein YqjF (DUF2071 family)